MVQNVISRSDQDLAIRLRDALRAVDGVVIADVTGGVVTLAGMVPSATMATQIVEMVSRVEDVIGVNVDRLAAECRDPVETDDWPQISAPVFEKAGIVKPVV